LMVLIGAPSWPYAAWGVWVGSLDRYEDRRAQVSSPKQVVRARPHVTL
jgi:hypothetical protein